MLSSYFDKIAVSDINQDILSGCEYLVTVSCDSIL